MDKELKDGEVGEYISWNLFIKQEWVKQVIDVRDDERFRQFDVDFLIEDYHRQFHWLEIKTDLVAHKTSKIAFEKISNKRLNTLGCHQKTRADLIAFYIPAFNKILLSDAVKLRELANSGKYEEQEMGDNAIGYLLPIRDLKKYGIIKKEYDV